MIKEIVWERQMELNRALVESNAIQVTINENNIKFMSNLLTSIKSIQIQLKSLIVSVIVLFLIVGYLLARFHRVK